MRRVLLVAAATLFMGALVASNGYASPCSADPNPSTTDNENACRPCNVTDPAGIQVVKGCLEDDMSGADLGCIGGNVVDPSGPSLVTGCVTVGGQSVCSDGAGNIAPCTPEECTAAANTGCGQSPLL